MELGCPCVAGGYGDIAKSFTRFRHGDGLMYDKENRVQSLVYLVGKQNACPVAFCVQDLL